MDLGCTKSTRCLPPTQRPPLQGSRQKVRKFDLKLNTEDVSIIRIRNGGNLWIWIYRCMAGTLAYRSKSPSTQVPNILNGSSCANLYHTAWRHLATRGERLGMSLARRQERYREHRQVRLDWHTYHTC